MDIFKRERTTQWIIILLVILNIFTIVTLWMQRGQRQPLPPPGEQGRQGHDVFRFLDMELDLSESQSRQLEEMRHRHHEERLRLEKGVLDTRRELLRLVTRSDTDSTEVQRLSRSIGERQAVLEQLTFQHFMEIKALCNRDQTAEFERLLREVLDRQPPPDRQSPTDRRPPDRRPPPRHRP